MVTKLKNPSNAQLRSREDAVGVSKTDLRTQSIAASVVSTPTQLHEGSSSSSTKDSNTKHSIHPVIGDSSTTKKTKSVAGSVIPEEERKVPFNDSSIVKPSSDPSTSEATELAATDQIAQLLQSKECKTLFSHILDSERLTDQEKLSVIREQMEQEVAVFGLSYNIGVVRNIIKYVSSDARRRQIALAEIDFAKVLIGKLPRGIPQVENLKVRYALILDLDISEEKKAQELSRAITTWQQSNNGIVESISSISLKGENIKVIPRYIAKFTNLKELNLSDNGITDMYPLANLVKLERLNLGCNKITYADLANLVELKYLTLNRSKLLDRYNLNNLKKLIILQFQDQNRVQRPSRRYPQTSVREQSTATSESHISPSSKSSSAFLRQPVSQGFDSINTESVVPPDRDKSLENISFLSNGRVVEILKEQIKIKERELSSVICEMKRDMNYSANLVHFLISGIATISWWFLSQYRTLNCSYKYYIVEKNPEQCPEYFFDSKPEGCLDLITTVGLNDFMNCGFHIYNIRKRLREHHQKFDITEEKNRALIERLQKLNPEDSLSASSLPHDFSGMGLSSGILQPMIYDMNAHQIVELRKHLGGDKFDSTFNIALRVDRVFQIKILKLCNTLVRGHKLKEYLNYLNKKY